MGKKMYYTEEEAIEALSISPEEFAKYIRDDKVRVFQDGPRKMFRVDEIDTLGGGGSADEEEIELAPIEAAGGEMVELTAADAPGGEDIELTVADAPGGEQAELAPGDAAGGEELELAPTEPEHAGPLTEHVDVIESQAMPPAHHTDPIEQAKPLTEQIDAIAAEAIPEKAEPASPDQGAEMVAVPSAEAEMAFEKTISLDRGTEELTLAEADAIVGKPKGKEDTVITAEGISIFDEEDLEIEAADPMAKTQIAPSLEDQISIEGVGSGSGLLDLTRESDDTSLGAEVLDHIDETTDGAAELEPVSVPEIEPYEPQSVAATVESTATFVEQVDPGAGMFGGMLIGSAIVALVLGSIPLASARGMVPEYLAWYKENILAVLIGAAVLVAVATLIGLFLGKAIADKQRAMRDINT